MITITNKNIFRSPISLDEMLDYDDVKSLDKTDVCNYLSEEVELGENTTFKRIFDIIKANSDIFDNIYFSILKGYPIEVFSKEIEKFPEEKVDLDFICIKWVADKYADLTMTSPSIEGVSKEKSYSIEFMPLNNIKYHKIVLDEQLVLLNYDEKKEEDKIQNLGFRKFTLFELFYAILIEISFNGSPSERETMLNDMFDKFSNIDENDQIDPVTIEKMFEEYENNDIYLVKYGNYRERIDEEVTNYKTIKTIKNCIIEKFKIFEKIENSNNNLHIYDEKLTNLEYNIQTLYGVKEDKTKHKFWQTPKCTCPKIENIEIYPSKDPIIDSECPIHKLER